VSLRNRLIPAGYAAVLIFLCCSGVARAKEFPRPVGQVNDFAGLMSPAAAQNLETTLREFRAKLGPEIAILTIGDMGGLDEQTYAVELMKDWGIGSKERNDGILLMVALRERRMKIEVGYGLEHVITDARSGQILDTYVVPNAKAGNWDAALTQGALAIASLIAEDSGRKLDEVISGQTLAAVPRNGERSGDGVSLVHIIVLAIIIFFLAGTPFGRGMLLGMFVSGMLGGGRRRSGGYGSFGGGFGGGGGFSGFGGGFSGGGGASRGF